MILRVEEFGWGAGEGSSRKAEPVAGGVREVFKTWEGGREGGREFSWSFGSFGEGEDESRGKYIFFGDSLELLLERVLFLRRRRRQAA